MNVLAADLAELTFAQLVDGLPLWDVATDQLKHTHKGEEHVYALREDQTAALTCFLESDPDEASLSCPMPILANRENVRRDYRVSMPKYKIYRDPWERKMMYSSYSEYRHESRDYRAYDVEPIERPEDACWMDSDSA